MLMCTRCGRAWRTALLTASCAMRSSSCSCSGRRPVTMPPPSKVQVTPPGTVERSASCSQRNLQSRAPGLIQAQRHHRAARLGQAVARQFPDQRQGVGQFRAALPAGGEFLHRTELQQDAGEGLRQAVVDLLADARALHEHRGLLGGIRQARQLHGERRLLHQRHQQAAVQDFFRRAREGQCKEADAACPEHQRVDHRALGVLAAVEGQHARPDLARLAADVEINRLTQIAEAGGEHRACHRHAGGVGRLRHLAVAHVRDDAPLLQRILAVRSRRPRWRRTGASPRAACDP